MQRFTHIYRIILLLISGLVELSVAVIMVFHPSAFLHELTFEETNLAHSFASGALGISLLSLLLLRFRSKETSIVGFSVLIVYHTGIGMAQHAMLPAVLFHSWLVFSFVFLLVRTLVSTNVE